MKIEINGKALLAAIALSSSFLIASFVSVVDAQSNGGVTVIQPEESAPIGTVAMWASSTPPAGWLEMNGQSTAGHSELAAIVGSNVPDLRGQFVRAWDNGAGVDSSRAINSYQSGSVQPLTFKGNALPAHAHNSTARGVSAQHAHDGDLDGSQVVTGYDKSTISSPATTSVSAGTPTGTIVGTGTETRPTNIALMYIIRAE